LYGAARIGDFVVITNYRPSSSGWAIILLSVTALALGGCGRKSGLDMPPSAAAPAAPVADTEAERAAQAEGATATPGSVFDPSFGANKDPVAPPGKKRSFILDPLLD
jgi:predicted small lipoprotein YifL